VRCLLNNRLLLASAGIPAAQIRHARQAVPDVAEHLDRRMEEVLARCLLRDNCYWHVYLNGRYPRQTCPEYLEEGNFLRLKAGLADRISVHTSTVQEFLRGRRPTVSRFALLDHFDWFCGESPRRFSQEWQALVDCANPGARFTWRSMGEHTDFVDDCRIEYGGATRRVGEVIEYDDALAADLQTRDRVNSYSCLRIGELRDRV
jgi:S-adenosylmethionine-diacylglycerol 3-amino-3-carboxypropyl transferase